MFLNTRYLSPVVMDGLTTAPPESYEWHEWWDLQAKYCKEGFKAGDVTITGRHYHYLNFWRILRQPDNGGTKRRLPPRFLDIDHGFYHEYDRCREAKKDLLVLKRRQCGFSYKNAQICGYEFTFVPDSYTVITSGVESYSVNTMKMVIDGLDAADATQFYKHREPDSEDFIQAMFKEKTEAGVLVKEGLLSVVHRITASNIQALVGKTLSMLLYEEIGKFKGVKDVKAYIDPGMEEMGNKTGIQVLIGTGGEEHESIDEVTDMFYDPDTYGLMSYDNDYGDEPLIDDAPKQKVCYFIPGDRFTEVTDTDGNSHPEKAREVIMRRREAKKKDKNMLLREITQFPLTPEEALMMPEGGKFNAYLLNQQKARLLKDPALRDIVQLGNIEWIRDGNNNVMGAEWVPDQVTGIYRMTEPPSLENGHPVIGLYVAGTDSYDKDKVADEKRASFGACRIHKQWNGLDEKDDLPVCCLVERPPTAEQFYEDVAKMCVFYGWAVNLIEYSNILIFDWLRRNGFGRLIRERPETAYANVANSKVQNRDGVDPNIKHVFEQIAVDWVEKNAHKIMDIQLVNKLIAYRSDKNCDESIAFMLSLMNAHENRNLAKREKATQKTFSPGRFSVKDGKMVRLW